MIYIVTIPGIGTFEKGYSKKFTEDILKFSKKTSIENKLQVIELLPCNETNIDTNQQSLIDRIDTINRLGISRKFVLKFFGDAVTFERNATSINSTYQNIHRYLKNEFEKVNKLISQTPNSKLVIVATSMGAQMLSTYIWDADNSNGIFASTPANSLNNLRNLSYLATIGCNIPLFISGLSEAEIIAFDKRNTLFIWENYFDQDDPLGWPLKQLSKSYNTLVTDYKINSGFTPIDSHLGYWDDNDFTKPFVTRLTQL